MGRITRHTTLALVADSKNIALQLALADMSPAQLADIFEKATKNAIFETLDDAGVENFTLLLHALHDAECLPHTTLQDGGVLYTLAETPEAIASLQVARRNCADAAIRIFRETRGWHLMKCKETANLLLSEVAFWWRDADSENDADLMFEFLRSYVIWSSSGYVRDKWNRALREATNTHFPNTRLVRHLSRLVEERSSTPSSDEAIARILALAWVRNRDIWKLAAEVRFLESHGSTIFNDYQYLTKSLMLGKVPSV